MTAVTRRQERRGTASAWATTNPVLAAGEWGVELRALDPAAAKVGDGTTPWNDLAYFGGSGGGDHPDSDHTGLVAAAGHTAESVLGSAGGTSLLDVPVPASRLFGRKATGPIGPLTPAEALALLAVYTAAQTDSAIAAALAALIDASPGTLNTLNELAAALGDDPNFATTVATLIGGKQDHHTRLDALAAQASAAFGRALLNLGDTDALRAALGITGTPDGAKVLQDNWSWAAAAGGGGGGLYPGIVDLPGLMPPSYATSWSYTYTGVAFGGFGSTGPAVNGEVGWDVVLDAGTWDAHLLYYGDGYRGIATIGTDDGAGNFTDHGTIDQYDAGGAGNMRGSVPGIVIPDALACRVRMKALAKHPDSAGYYLTSQHLRLVQVA